jgi:hypothetical protein
MTSRLPPPVSFQPWGQPEHVPTHHHRFVLRPLEFDSCPSASVGLCYWPHQRPGAEPGSDPALDEAVQKLMSLEQGQDLRQFQPIERAVSAARTDERLRAEIEARLIGVLRGDSTELAKDYACRQLVTVGADDAITALSELVPHPRMSYMARFGLEGIGGPGAARALRELLDKTEGPADRRGDLLGKAGRCRSGARHRRASGRGGRPTARGEL